MGRGDWLRVGVLWLVVTAANLFKPFHIDDTAHLEIARWITDHPLHPMSGLLNWSGTAAPIFDTNQPHLFFYLLAGWAKLFGYSEVSLHVLQSVFAFAAIALFYSLAARLVPSLRFWLTAMVALGPAFVVEQNVMMDIALLAVWLAFFRLLLLGIEGEHQTARYVGLASLASVAVLTKYSSLVLVAVLVLALLVERRWRQLWVVLVPVGALLAWSAFNIADIGSAHVLHRPAAEATLDRVLDSTYLWILTLGGILPLGVMVVGLVLARRVKAIGWLAPVALLAALVVLGVLVATGAMTDSTADRVLRVGFLVNGFAVVVWLGFLLVGALRHGLRRLVEPARLVHAYLLVWVLATSVFYVVLGPFVAARHVLLIVPPLLLLFGEAFRSVATRGALAAGLAVTVVVSLGLGVSDWRFASFYRDSAPAITSSLPDGARVWTNGHWGWQWYAGKEGVQQLDYKSPDDVRSGDYIVMAESIDGYIPPLRPREVVSTTVGGTDLASLLCTARYARFYATSYYGPWSLSRECTGNFTVYRVL